MTLIHPERHFTGNRAVRDLVLGMADGLTVPFALAAGLGGGHRHYVDHRGGRLAEIAAGAIAMGLGGYLGGAQRCRALRERAAPRAARGARQAPGRGRRGVRSAGGLRREGRSGDTAASPPGVAFAIAQAVT
jgi:hypothetical protein